MQLLDGRYLAREILSKVKAGVTVLKQKPGLAAILVGDDPASHLYVRLKQEAAIAAGIHFEKFVFSRTARQDEIIATVQELNTRKDIHAVLVQLPLPHGFSADLVVAAIAPWKDVDGFHPENLRQMGNGVLPKNLPPVVLGIMRLVNVARASVVNASAVILAKSEVFALPLALILKQQGAAVAMIQPQRGDWCAHEARLKSADVVISAVGQAGIITGDMVKPGAVLIDVGTNRVVETIDGIEHGRVVGDIDAASCEALPGYLSPVPGGVGPLTVAYLLANTVELARHQIR